MIIFLMQKVLSQIEEITYENIKSYLENQLLLKPNKDLKPYIIKKEYGDGSYFIGMMKNNMREG